MKRVLSTLLALCLMLTLTPAVLAADTTTYSIGTADELIAFAEKVNSGSNSISAVLTDDIDLTGKEFTPIGTVDKPFNGTFDGNGKTIKNIEITGYTNTSRSDSALRVGIFGTVTGKVTNLTLDNIKVTSTATDIGSGSTNDDNEVSSGVAIGTLEGGTAEAITVLATCSVQGKLRVGGVVGDSRGYATISGCTNYASVTGSSDYVGGIVGAAHDITSYTATVGTTVKYCVNNGNVSGASAVGGIVGYADRAKVLNSDNHRNITGTGNYGTGGIIGCDIYNPRLGVFIPPNGSTMDTCTNYGDVSAPRAGGILGSYVVSPGQSQPTLSRYTRYSKITVCKNFGAIKSPDGNGKCGSIYGAPISYASGDDESYVNHIVVQISGCTVGGTVEGVSAPSSTTDSAFATFISPSNCVQLLDGNVLQEVSQ